MAETDIKNVKYLLRYSKYQESDMGVEYYCRLNNLDYLDFVRFINKWEDVHGSKAVEGCMDCADITSRLSKHAEYIPSRAQRLFKELVVEPERGEQHSYKRFPSNPDLTVNLEHPKPNTMVRSATILFPSGVELTFQEATIKSLILSVVMYEEADSWIK